MKGQPLAYNRDNQEDKQPLFDAVDTVQACLTAYTGMLAAVSVNRGNMNAAAARGFATATDLADYLVRRNVAFRDAHAVVGQVVQYALENGRDLAELSLDELRGFSDSIEEDVFECLTLEGSIASRDHAGGTAPVRVRTAAARAREYLQAQADKMQG
jgi:argininosuccinate lyase